MGVCSEEISGISRANLFKSMMNMIDAPQRFLPVSSVHVRPAQGDAGDDGALWRTMTYTGQGPMHGRVLVQHIYANPAAGEIRYVGLDADGRSEGECEIVNVLRRDPMRIEYYQRKVETRERVHWEAPRANALKAMETTIALARAQEVQQSDPNFVGIKA